MLKCIFFLKIVKYRKFVKSNFKTNYKKIIIFIIIKKKTCLSYVFIYTILFVFKRGKYFFVFCNRILNFSSIRK